MITSCSPILSAILEIRGILRCCLRFIEFYWILDNIIKKCWLSIKYHNYPTQVETWLSGFRMRASWFVHSTLFVVLEIDRLKRVNTMGCEIFGLELKDPKSTYQLLYWYCLWVKEYKQACYHFFTYVTVADWSRPPDYWRYSLKYKPMFILWHYNVGASAV